MSDLMEATTELEVEYTDNIATNTRNYSEIGDNDVWELVPEVEIGKLVSLGYFDNQSILYLASIFLIRLAVKAPKLI